MHGPRLSLFFSPPLLPVRISSSSSSCTSRNAEVLPSACGHRAAAAPADRKSFPGDRKYVSRVHKVPLGVHRSEPNTGCTPNGRPRAGTEGMILSNKGFFFSLLRTAVRGRCINCVVSKSDPVFNRRPLTGSTMMGPDEDPRENPFPEKCSNSIKKSH